MNPFYRRRSNVWLLLLAVWFSPVTLCAGPAGKMMRAFLFTKGSVPTGRVLFACIYELNGKPFSDTQIDDCVKKLSTNYFIRKINVNKKEMDNGAWISVEFTLTADSLSVNEFNIETFDDQQTEIMKFLSLNKNNLHVGGIFSLEAESSTYDSLRQFYRARGKAVAMVPEVNLDYKEGRAGVKFKIVPGPTIPSQPLPPPYGSACSDRIMYVDWTGADDKVPVELVESGLTLRAPFSCFSDELARHDKTYLSELPLLSTGTVDYSGPEGSRRVRYELKGKPLKVKQITFQGFGDMPSQLGSGYPNLESNLSLKVGDTFSHSATAESVDYLKKLFSENGYYWAEVTAQEESSGTLELAVTFSILRIPLQTMIVDGREIK